MQWDEDLADGVGLPRGDAHPARILSDVLKRVEAGQFAHLGGEKLAQQRLVVVAAQNGAQVIPRIDVAGPAPSFALLLVGIGGYPHHLAQRVADYMGAYGRDQVEDSSTRVTRL